MDAQQNFEREKTIQLIAFFTYIASTKELRTTLRNEQERIQIAYCFMLMVETQIKFNLNLFSLYLDEFVNLEHEAYDIAEFIGEQEPYSCREEQYAIELKIWDKSFEKTKEALRQINHKFSKKLLKIGLFYRLISQEHHIDDIIATSLQKIKNREVPIATLCKNSITFDFLSLFFQGHGKKECEENLKAFFKHATTVLETSK